MSRRRPSQARVPLRLRLRYAAEEDGQGYASFETFKAVCASADGVPS